MRPEIKNVGSSLTFASFEHLCSHVHLSRGKRAESEMSVCTWKEQVKDEIFFIPSFHPHLHLSPHLLSLAFCLSVLLFSFHSLFPQPQMSASDISGFIFTSGPGCLDSQQAN